jgi:hypothetical protein
MERYDVGDRVVSGVDAQVMRRGERFEVIGRDEQHLFGNVYATLTLRSIEDGRELRIVNAPLLLSRATT